MKLLSMSIKQPLASILALASTAIFSVAGVAYAQYGDNTSGQGSSAGQSGSAGQGSSTGTFVEEPFPYDILQEPMEAGYVDQRKRVERASDPASPSSDTHVPDFPVGKDGKPLKDPTYEQQGGPIGPN